MATLSTEKKRSKRIQEIQRNIEALIFTTDDSEDILLLGTLLLQNAKNIFLTHYPADHTSIALHKYVDEVCKNKSL